MRKPTAPLPERILPTEILRKILRLLSNDKPLLATCMRVSPSFNEIAAPILYEKIRYNKSTSRLFDVVPSPKGLGKKRKTACKGDNLRLLKILEVIEHGDEDCPGHRKAGSFDVLIPILRLLVLPQYEGTGDQVEVYNTAIRAGKLHFHSGPSGCPAVDRLRARKVVLPDARMNTPIQLRTLSQQSISRVVSIIRPQKWSPMATKIKAFDLHDRQARPPTIVIWTDGPKLNLSTDFLLDDLGDAVLRSRLSLAILWNLFTLISTRGFPKTLLIVNIEALAPHLPDDHQTTVNVHRELVNDHVGDGTDSTPVELWARRWLSRVLTGSGVLLDSKVHRTRSISIDPGMNLPARNKFSEEIKPSKFEFMTMQEYLATHDWTGEFTPEEVAPWLNPEAEEANVEEV